MLFQNTGLKIYIIAKLQKEPNIQYFNRVILSHTNTGAEAKMQTGAGTRQQGVGQERVENQSIRLENKMNIGAFSNLKPGPAMDTDQKVSLET